MDDRNVEHLVVVLQILPVYLMHVTSTYFHLRGWMETQSDSPDELLQKVGGAQLRIICVEHSDSKLDYHQRSPNQA